MVPEEERIFAGKLFAPGDPELRALKLKAHNLSARYSRTFEDEVEERARILAELVGSLGEGSFMQGPIFFHYGVHTTIGKSFFGNYNLTVQDDARVTIGDNVAFGPNVSIVTPMHPLVAKERYLMLNAEGRPQHLCYALPVIIGNDVWVAANVVICGGVTIGNGCVIGAGSVVTRDIPANSLAAGSPCRVIRAITEADSMKHKPNIAGDCRVIEA